MERRKDHLPPSRWQDFEDFCLMLWRTLLRDIKKNGRSGQPQSGVDIYGYSAESNGWWGIQCKQKTGWPKNFITLDEIEKEVSKAETFQPPLSHFIIAATIPRNSKVQKAVRLLSDQRRRHGLFSVDIESWDDLVDRIYETKLRIGERPEVHRAKLPPTNRLIIGRDNEFEFLNRAWQQARVNVVVLVALGGIGKTALVNEWLNRMEVEEYRGASRILGWSFYSQGSTLDRHVTSDFFLEYALQLLGDPDPNHGRGWEKGERLARLLRRERVLLVLDGLETLQFPPGGDRGGSLREPAMQALLRDLAAKNPGLCVVTTRLKIDDLKTYEGANVVTHEMRELSSVIGGDLLRELGVRGSTIDLQEAASDFGGHAQALILLGSYLRDVHGGLVTRRDQIPNLFVDPKEGGHTRRVMLSYESWFRGKPELQILLLLGLFDRPVSHGIFETLLKVRLPGLNDLLIHLSKAEMIYAIKSLRDARLLSEPDPSSPELLDCHPIVREHVAERLRSKHTQASKSAHHAIYEGLRKDSEEYPDTLVGLSTLYLAVRHGCAAGLFHEVFADVYKKRIHRGVEYYPLMQFGAFGADLAALACFFDEPWTKLPDDIDDWTQGEIYACTGFNLAALGRLRDAIAPTNEAVRIAVALRWWLGASRVGGNLSLLTLALGEVDNSIQIAKMAVEYGDRSGDALRRTISRAILANCIHQSGDYESALTLFREAESLQVEAENTAPHLFSFRGYLYNDLLLSCGSANDVIDRTNWSMKKAAQDGKILIISLEHLSLGRALLALGDMERAAQEFEKAVDGLRQSEYQDELPRGLLARAELHLASGRVDLARADLLEAVSLAERYNLKLLEVDGLLGLGRLYLIEGESQQSREAVSRAGSLIDETGYHRRDRQLEDLEGQLKG